MANKNKTKPKTKKSAPKKKGTRRVRQKKSAGGIQLLPYAIVAVIILIVGAVAYLFLTDYFDKDTPEPPVVKDMGDVVDDIYKPKAAQASKFAEYEEVAVNINPQVADYTVSQGLTNVINADDFVFSQDAEDLFVKNGFVVIPAKYDEFFSVYEMNRYADTPNFITTDSILHNYHLMFNYLLKNLEEEKLTYELQDLNEAMLGAAMEQYESLAGTEWENAAKRNVAFFSVGSVLLDEDVEIPQIVQDEVDEELNLIEAHAGITLSPVMNLGADADILDGLKEDYSQYIPRGHYDQSDELKAYFKTMMWYGRLTFRFKNEDEVKSAILITLALSDDDSKALWERIYEPTNFFVGKSDDISCYDFEDLVEQIYGKMDIDAVTGDATKFASFVASAKELEPPQINSMPIFNDDIQPDREAEIEGFRFMGQRFTIDASIFQRLVDREVKDRMLPKGLDITAAMGSDEALDILEGMGETDYEDYSDNMSKMKKYVADLTADTWTQNLYWGWLHSLLPLVEEKSAGYPSFMRNLAWVRKELNTYLGSWAELKHDTILYAKQVYAELGGGPREEVDDRGYVEPNPYVYARLASLIKMTKEGLEIRDLLSSDNKNTLELMEELVLSLKTISEKELNNQSLTDDEYELIRSYGGQLEHFWIEALRSEGVTSTAQLSEHPAAIVADVATDPNGFVLEEGIGHINEIYAVVPIDGELRVVKGGVFSYYEFSWPLADRLTDSAWRELLDSDEAPALPEWTSVFTEQ